MRVYDRYLAQFTAMETAIDQPIPKRLPEDGSRGPSVQQRNML